MNTNQVAIVPVDLFLEIEDTLKSAPYRTANRVLTDISKRVTVQEVRMVSNEKPVDESEGESDSD